MHPQIASHSTEIAEICRRYRVRRLEVFGSAARGSDFDLARSDADFLVEFDGSSDRPALDEYFGFQESLSRLLGRQVDLVEAGAVRNPYVLANIDRTKESVYAA
jgi:predicted nucleotidyltransferase